MREINSAAMLKDFNEQTVIQLMKSCLKCPQVTFWGSGLCLGNRGRVGVGGERRNFAQLLRKCIVVDNPLEIEIGRGSGS